MILFDVPDQMTAAEFRERRQALGSQRSVAGALRLSRHTLSRWENSRSGLLSWHPTIVRLALEALEARHETFVPELPDPNEVYARAAEASAAGA